MLRSAGRWRIGLAVTLLVGGVLSAIAYVRGLPELRVIPQLDKVLHFGLAGSIAFFLHGVLKQRRVLTLPLAGVLVVVACAIEEYMQRFVPTRNSSLGDFAADVAGVVVSLAFARSRPAGSDRRSD